MKAIRSHYLCRSTSLALVLLMTATVVAPGLTWAAPAQTVLVMPVSSAADNAPLDIGDRATSALTMALDAVPGFDAMGFSPVAPSVRRAVSEGRIRQVDVDEGTRDVASALSMAAALRADLVVIASVQSFTRKDKPASVELIMAGQMYAVGANMNPATGEPIAEPKVQKAFGVSGASPARAKFNGAEGALTQEALRDAAYKAAQTLSGVADVGGASVHRKKSGDVYKWALLALLLGGLAVAVGSSSGGNNHDVVTGAEPTNVVLQQFDVDHIQVSWTQPAEVPSYYQVQRKVGSGGSWGMVDGGSYVPQTSKNDYGLLSGTHTYYYRVRAVYGNNVFSQWVEGNIGLTITVP
jgi:hypothetical protein